MKSAKTSIIPPADLLSAYSQGIFPMASDAKAKEVEWYTALYRGIIPMDSFKVSQNVLRIIKKGAFEIKLNTAFKEVMKACAERESTWISKRIIQSYTELHRLGFAHSVEVWKNDELVGGLYGVRLEKAFFGESMFKREKEMDKVALYFAHLWLKSWGCTLWDTQFWTEHLAQFGCIEIEADEYQARLQNALKEFAI